MFNASTAAASGYPGIPVRGHPSPSEPTSGMEQRRMNVRFEALSRRLSRDVRRRQKSPALDSILEFKAEGCVTARPHRWAEWRPYHAESAKCAFGQKPAGAGGTCFPGRSSLPDEAEIGGKRFDFVGTQRAGDQRHRRT